MRKSLNSGKKGQVFRLFFAIGLAAPLIALAADNAPLNVLSNTLLERAQKEVDRVAPLVADGTLPKSSLEEAKAKLADAEDQEILAETLYGETLADKMTAAQVEQMLGAAQRRVDRQRALVNKRQILLETGIIARSELTVFQDELESRQRVLELAKSRAQLMDELAQMAAAEKKLAHAATAAQAGTDAIAKDVMIRFGGNGLFSLNNLPTISTEFQKHFHSPLPVSALGQTLVHQSLGLDHRNRVDVALNPDSAEGIWLRHLLETLQIPYLAFRAAVAGAATAPHIHIGPESTRLRLVSR